MSEAPEGSPPPAKARRGSRGDLESRAHATRDELRAQVLATKAQIEATNERIEARTGRNLPAAILIGVVLGGLVLVSLIVVKEFFMLFGAVLVGFTALELASALRFAGRDVPRWPTVIVALASVPAAFYWSDDGKWLAFLAGVLIVALWRTVEVMLPAHRVSMADYWKDIGAGTFIQAYVPFLGTFAVLLTAQEGGQWWTLAFLILVVVTDTGAYAAGLTLGRHPMAPRISPKKTWEGFGGAVAAALIAGVLLSIFMIDQPWWFGLIFGGAIVLTATIGDLSESLIKRDLGIKDISTWLPGHGGFLDRIDSILPSAAVAYGLFLIFA